MMEFNGNKRKICILFDYTRAKLSSNITEIKIVGLKIFRQNVFTISSTKRFFDNVFIHKCHPLHSNLCFFNFHYDGLGLN